MAELIKNLCLINGVSGNEHEVRRYILGQIKDKADEITIDSMGNIIALVKGNNHDKRIMVVSNIDECGFIVSGVTDKGYLKIKNVGKIDDRVIISKKVLIRDKVSGVIGMKAIHVQKKSERESTVAVSDLFVDIGASSKKSALGKVNLGDYVSFDAQFNDNGTTIFAKALDRMGCVSLISAMGKKYEYDTYFVFSVQREVACRGAAVAAHRINPHIVISMDTIESADMYGTDEKNINAKAGMGAVISMADKSVINNRPLYERIFKTAQKHKISVQAGNNISGMSMGGAAQSAADGAVVCTVSIPCRYSHTPLCMMNKNDIYSSSKLLSAILEEIGEITNGIIK